MARDGIMAMDTATAYRSGMTTAEKREVYHIGRPEIKKKTAYHIVKRAFDFVLALVGLIVLLIPMLIIALIIVIDSPGGAIFTQERLGKGGKPFVMYKFRSMTQDAEAEGPRWAVAEDTRCTHFGSFLRKTRLDELPQLYNILRGDMSFVGPRPERKYFYDEFERYIDGFSYRLLATPGLTGYAQVNGGYDLLPEEKIMYDVEYIEKQSLLLDTKCLLKTFKLVLTHEGAR